MIAHNPYSNCTDARLYYYDYLSEETRAAIPESMLAHITQCWDCQAEIDRLGVMLACGDQNMSSAQSWKDSAVSTILKLHFAYVGEPVNCEAVKPFMASLADPLLHIRIPTPITRHVERCRDCAEAVTSLVRLHLTHKQLCRLGQLLADDPVADGVSCAEAQAAIPAVASMAFDRASADILRHVCICPDCRRELFLQREAIRRELLHNDLSQDDFPCAAVRTSDIYEYALPYGFDPAKDQYAEFRKPLLLHVQSCPGCLAKMQELHRTVCGIAEQPESGVQTVYHLDDPVEAPLLDRLFDPVAGELATTECEDEERQPQAKLADGPASAAARTSGFEAAAARFRRRISALNVRPVLRAGLAAAAVVLIGLALLLNAPTAGAVTLDTIYGAVARITNVYIASFADHGTTPIQERWISQNLNMYLMKRGYAWALFDIGGGVRKSKDSRTGASEEFKLTRDDVATAKTQMSITLAFMPFRNLSNVPTDAQWSKVTDVALQANTKGTEVYDLTWTEKSYTGVVYKKWQAFVDPGTKLPRRVDLYQKQSAEDQYSLVSMQQIKYLTDAQIETVVKDVSF
jgi:hypothetical protein